MRRAALRSALSVKAGQQQIVVVDHLELPEPKTREMREVLTRLNVGENALILLPGRNETVEKSVRNLPKVKALHASYLNIRDLLQYEKVVMPLGALQVIESILG
jgi:large subunit ribosomal protein L4